MASQNILLLPGDGIGPEVCSAAERVIAWFSDKGTTKFETENDLVGGSAYDAHGVAISEAAVEKAAAADAVLLGRGRRAQVGRCAL